jgi:carbamoyltransferase
MALAAYGDPDRFYPAFRTFVDCDGSGNFAVDGRTLQFRVESCAALERLFGPRRGGEEELDDRFRDIAAALQRVTNTALLGVVRRLKAQTGSKNLCLAGGVALNCVANGKVLRDGVFRDLWIQPAAGDAGGALGAALAAHYLFEGNPRAAGAGDAMRGSLLGPEFAQAEIEERLRRAGARFEAMNEAELVNACVNALEREQAVGWFQGRMEFGPRALGARSILADPRSARMQSTLNLKVKRRESFRPFAPSVLRERVSDYFELDRPSPYMLLVADVARRRRMAMTEEQKALFGIEKLNVPRSDIPAVTHVDYSARVQTVDSETNPKYHALLRAWEARTGCAVLVNTSFNVRGEPIVCTPEDAYRCFMGTGMDALAVGNCFLRKAEQRAAPRGDYAAGFEED